MGNVAEGRTVWQLARLADVSEPESTDSPGAEWLRLVEGDAPLVAERLAEGEDLSDVVHQHADSLVPVYTHERWLVFVDLGAYEVDIDDLVGGVEDMTTLAGVALYEVARNLLWALVGDLTAETDDEVTS